MFPRRHAAISCIIWSVQLLVTEPFGSPAIPISSRATLVLERRPPFIAKSESIFMLRETSDRNDRSGSYTENKRQLEKDLSSAEETAEELRNRARELRAEAQLLEQSLRATHQVRSKRKKEESRSMMEKVFFGNRPLTPDAVARVMREERWSIEQVVSLLQTIYKQQVESSTELVSTTPSDFLDINKEHLSSNVTPMSSSNQTEPELLQTYVQCIFEAAAILDEESSQSTEGNGRRSSASRSKNVRWQGNGCSVLKSRYTEWQKSDQKEFERRLAVRLDEAVGMNASVEEYMTHVTDPSKGPGSTPPFSKRFNASSIVADNIKLVPLWVPSSLLPHMLSIEAELDPKDLHLIREKILPNTHFYCTSSDSIPSAAIFRGNMRPRDALSMSPKEIKDFPATVLADITKRLDLVQGEGEGLLSDRVQLFLLEDPEWRPNRVPTDPKPRPVLLVLPKSVTPIVRSAGSIAGKVLRQAGVLFSLLTTFAFSVGCYALNSRFFESVVNRSDISVFSACLPVFLGILATQLVHELAHARVAKRRGMKIGWPMPLPSTHIGLFGCITPLRAFPSNRKDMLDFSLSGPVSAAVVSLILMVVGARQTVRASAAAIATFPTVPVAFLKSSYLTGTLLSFLLPKVMTLPLSQPIPIHPFFMVGFSGLLASAVNLLPIFRLDGGRACTAAMGSRFGSIASVGSLLFMISLALGDGSNLALAWVLMISFFQRRPDIPARDEITEPNDIRISGWVASLALAVLALAPFPGGPGFL